MSKAIAKQGVSTAEGVQKHRRGWQEQ
jgi:hypothetical protein